MIKNKYRNWSEYLLVFLLVCFSGNSLFIFSPYIREGMILFAFALLVLCVTKNKTSVLSGFLVYSIPIMLIMLYHMTFFINSQVSTNIFVLLKMFVGSVAIGLLGERFIPRYVDVMVALALISLVIYTYIVFFGLLPAIPVMASGDSFDFGTRSSLLVYTQFSSDIEAGRLRNTGMFWEAGAHQGFLNLALLLMARYPRTKENKIKMLILSLALLTTQSTTGYVVFMLVVCTHLSTDRSRSQAVRFTLMAFFLALSAYLYRTVAFLGAKIQDNLAEVGSSQGRVTDYINYSDQIFEHFLLGSSYNIQIPSGNGFFYQIICIGIVGVLFLMIPLYTHVKKNTTTTYALWFLFSIVIMYQGEGFLSQALFLGLPFLGFPKTGVIKN